MQGGLDHATNHLRVVLDGIVRGQDRLGHAVEYLVAGISWYLSPASSALTTQSGTPAIASALLAENSCQTPDGPAAWMSTSSLFRPALRSEASRA